MKFLSFEIQGDLFSPRPELLDSRPTRFFSILEVPSTCRVEDQYYCTMLREKTENILISIMDIKSVIYH